MYLATLVCPIAMSSFRSSRISLPAATRRIAQSSDKRKPGAPSDLSSAIVILVQYVDLDIRILVLNVLGDDHTFCFETGITRHGQRKDFESCIVPARPELNYVANHGGDLSLVSRDCLQNWLPFFQNIPY
jgi:hypothetical protein